VLAPTVTTGLAEQGLRFHHRRGLGCQQQRIALVINVLSWSGPETAGPRRTAAVSTATSALSRSWLWGRLACGRARRLLLARRQSHTPRHALETAVSAAEALPTLGGEASAVSEAAVWARASED